MGFLIPLIWTFGDFRPGFQTQCGSLTFNDIFRREKVFVVCFVTVTAFLCRLKIYSLLFSQETVKRLASGLFSKVSLEVTLNIHCFLC